MITPKTHPQHFDKVTVGDYSYFTYKVVGLGLQEDLQDAYADGYRAAKPDELLNGAIDEKLFNTWFHSRDGKRATSRIAAKFLFVPATENTPAMEGAQYEILPSDVFDKAFNLFAIPSKSNTSVQPSTTSNGVTSPDSVTTTNP